MQRHGRDIIVTIRLVRLSQTSHAHHNKPLRYRAGGSLWKQTPVPAEGNGKPDCF